MKGLFVVITVLASLAVTSACARDRFLFPVNPTAPTQTATPPPPAPTIPQPNPPSNRNSPGRIQGVPISLGLPVSGAVEPTDPVCYPGWDSTATCRQYDLVAPADGTLSAKLKWPGPGSRLTDPDVFIVEPGDGYAYAPGDWPEKVVTRPAHQGWAYRIVVLAYVQHPQEYELLVELK